MGHEAGGIFPLAARYATSNVGNSDHNLPEHISPETVEALTSDDVDGSGVFDDTPNVNRNDGVFATSYSLPGYAARETGFGPSETIDAQTGENVEVYYSGLMNNVAAQGVYPTSRGPAYAPNGRDMADTDFAKKLPMTPIYNQSGIIAEPVLQPMTDPGAPSPPQQSISGFGFGNYQASYGRPAGLSLGQQLMERTYFPAGRAGVADLVQPRFFAPPSRSPARGSKGLSGLGDLPLGQMALLGVFAGAILGAGLSVAFPSKKGGRLPMSYAGIPTVSDTDYYMAPKRDVRDGMLHGLGAVLKQEGLFCSPGVTTKHPFATQANSREAMRRMLAAVGVATYPGRPWTSTEQNAWNAYNKQKGLQPMLFGKYPMGTQCKTLIDQFTKTPNGGSVAGLGASPGMRLELHRKHAAIQGFGADTPVVTATPATQNAIVIPPNLTSEEILAIKEAADELGIPNPLETGDGSGTTVVVQQPGLGAGFYLALAGAVGLAYYVSTQKSGGSSSGKKSRRGRR